MVTHICVRMTEKTSKDSFSLKASASLGCLSSGSYSYSKEDSRESMDTSSIDTTTTSSTSSDSGEKTLNSGSTSICICARGHFQQLHKIFTSDEEDEEDWSISENFHSNNIQLTHPDPTLYIPTYRLMTALDIWIQEIRGQTENEAPSPLINKPLSKSPPCT